LCFEFFLFGNERVASPQDLFDRIRDHDGTGAPVLGMLHYTECSDLETYFEESGNGLQNGLTFVLFSGDPLRPGTVARFVESAKKAGVENVFWFERRYDEAIVRPEFRAFFEWLAKANNPSGEMIRAKLEAQLHAMNTGEAGREIISALKVLCEAWLLNNWSRGDAYSRLPALKGALQLEGDKPAFPESFRLQHPETITKWLAPFRELAGTEQDDALIERIIESLDGEEQKTTARKLFADLTTSVEFERIADSFFIFNGAVKAHT
jgi:hypothetical protein